MFARRIALLISALPLVSGAQDAAPLITVPALTPVAVRLEELISSNKNKIGDHFRITVAEDVRVGDVEVRLRSFALGVVGKDQAANSLAASMIIGPFAMFVKGGVITVPPATLGIAKTALEFKLPAIVTSTPAGQSVESIKGEENESKVD
jgi:hypothetical protein